MVTKSRKKKQNNSKGLIILIVVVIIIAAISILAGYYFSDNYQASKSDTAGQSVKPKEKPLPLKSILDGTWVSNYDGAILTIKGLTFSLELPSVDKQVAIEGTVRIHQQTAVFINTSENANCRKTEGSYRFSFKGEELFFAPVKDDCTNRKERMSVSWFKL